MELIDELLRMVVPSVEEEVKLDGIVRTALDKVREAAAARSAVVGVELGGSVAKGTWLAGGSDIDIFVKFDVSTPTRQFTHDALNIGFEALKEYKPYTRHAAHPYVEADMNGTKLNVVPCYNTEMGAWLSAADRSSYHTAYMKRNLSANAKNEIRILKKFLMAQRVYGSQMETQGFSGYVTEVLILNFGTFHKTVDTLACIRHRTIIGKTSKEFDTPIVIMDPIDDRRNLAAAISYRSMGRCILACRKFQKSPSMKMFGHQDLVIHPHQDAMLSVEFAYSDRSPETIWGQAKGAASAIARRMTSDGFVVIRHCAVVKNNMVQIFLLFESLSIPAVSTKAGPNVFRREQAAKFARINSGSMTWVGEDGKLRCVGRRRHTQAESLLRHIMDNPKIAGISGGLHADIGLHYTIHVGIEAGHLQGATHLLSSDVM